MATFQQEEKFDISIAVQGDTGTPSQIKIVAKKNNQALANTPFNVRARLCNLNTFANSTNGTIAPVSGKGSTVKTHTSAKDLELQSQPNVAATGVLTISGAVIDGQTVTLGSRVYEFDAGKGLASVGRVAADITASTTKSSNTLTVDTQPTAGDTMTIGGRTYVFVASGEADHDGEISIGANLTAAQTNIVAAINGTDGWNLANSSVTAGAFAADASTITARVGGVAGDSIATAETFTAGSNVFSGATLGSGADCSAANAVTALVAAINGDSSAVVTAADGAGDTVDITAKATGTSGNSIASTETMANGSFGGAQLSGGAAGLPGELWIAVTDASVETTTLRLGGPEFGGLVIDYAGTSGKINVSHAAA